MEVNVTATGTPNVFNVTVAQSGSGGQGPKGDPGKSAYQIAVDNGFVGTEQEWLDSLQGEPGPAGQDGQDGEQGPKGDPGEQGIPGTDGQQGAPGEDGESAYQIWLNEGNEGTEQDFLDSLVGPQGEQGIQGIQGEKGDTGDTGAAGADGSDGQDGITPHIDEGSGNWFIGETDTGVHAEGPQGIQGDEGPQGPQGIPGTTDYNELTNKPPLGTAAAASVEDFATAAQGLLADTAVQPLELQNVVQVSANKTLELTENLSFQNVTAASTITIPDNASVAFPIGAVITIALESGTATIAAASGVTTVSLNNNLTLDTVGQVAVLKKTGTDKWFIGINGGA